MVAVFDKEIKSNSVQLEYDILPTYNKSLQYQVGEKTSYTFRSQRQKLIHRTHSLSMLYTKLCQNMAQCMSNAIYIAKL